jgi:photosystem II protein
MKIIFSIPKNSSYIEEKTFPIIKLTKSRSGETGTATFVFLQPNLFKKKNFFFSIEDMSLISENKKIITKDITVIFYKGKPFLLKSIFLFKNDKEWFLFLNIMQKYSKELGFSFSNKNLDTI